MRNTFKYRSEGGGASWVEELYIVVLVLHCCAVIVSVCFLVGLEKTESETKKEALKEEAIIPLSFGPWEGLQRAAQCLGA